MTRAAALLLLALGSACAACNGTTGDELLSFPAYAAGVGGASQPFVVNGFKVQLTTAKMNIGAVYVDESPLQTGAEGPTCIAPGVYAAQVPGPVEVDLLSTAPQAFCVPPPNNPNECLTNPGNGTADTGLSWQIWLTDGDVNELNTTHMVDLQGVATRTSDGAVFSFGAVVTINSNRQVPDVDPSQPGLNPICKQRIIPIGPIDVQFFQGGALNVSVDPRPWFNRNIDFSTLPLTTDDSCLDGDSEVPIELSDYGNAQYCIPDTNFAMGAGAEQGQQLFDGIQTAGESQPGNGGSYSLSYSNAE
jgi:hypothetical protein